MIQLNKEEKPFNNDISFVPHFDESKLSDKINDNDKSDSVTTNMNETGNQFAYETVDNENEGEIGGNSVSQQTTEFNLNLKSHHDENSEGSNKNVFSTTEGLPLSSSALETTTTTYSSSNAIKHDESTNGIKISEETTQSTIKNKHEKNNSSASTSSNNNDYEVKRFILEDQDNKRNNITVKKSWSKWKHWSSCSRSCGEGVKFQSRECTRKV